MGGETRALDAESQGQLWLMLTSLGFILTDLRGNPTDTDQWLSVMLL